MKVRRKKGKRKDNCKGKSRGITSTRTRVPARARVMARQKGKVSTKKVQGQ